MIKSLFNLTLKINLIRRNHRTMPESQKLKIFVTQPISEEAASILTSANCELEINQESPLSKDKLFEKIKDIDGLFCTLNERVDESVLNNANNLKVCFFVF